MNTFIFNPHLFNKIRRIQYYILVSIQQALEALIDLNWMLWARSTLMGLLITSKKSCLKLVSHSSRGNIYLLFTLTTLLIVLCWTVSWFGSLLDLENVNHNNKNNTRSHLPPPVSRLTSIYIWDAEWLSSWVLFSGIAEAPVWQFPHL